LIDWRLAFLLLAIPGFFLARELWRTVPEPLRGGQSRLEPGVTDLGEALAAAHQRTAQSPQEGAAGDGGVEADDDLAHQAAQRQGARPDPRLVLTEDPQDMKLMRAIRYILSIPSNL